MSNLTENAPAAASPAPPNYAQELEQLADLALLVASARDAMSDEMVARLARSFSEGVALLDRLTRNEGLMRLLQVLDRPETQHLLLGFSKALSQMSREVAIAPPARGGIAGIWQLVREPGTQEALRSLSVLGQYWSESMRELDRQATQGRTST
ncbi:MAG TPA: hypothetical protein VLV56_01510 [Burkholderiales bacterium]|nr:hypothetical protein [Burkholderiales bacterium]